MPLSAILTALDREIEKLQQARTLLARVSAVSEPVVKKRNLTPDGRKRTAEAVKARWAKQKKSGPK